MKKFNYSGNGILSFTHQEMDYLVHESGPHSLPEESELVQSLVAQKILVEIQQPAPKQNRSSNI